ncbi:Tim17/Tim22/Tim23/Pmp24 family-domain-containing protein [Myxozyma melibiosi]|uniref:Mitochondrial import inner membrane translocase subunit TIM22 n=1 Tax=Myxozyma melibiosi TaxID=54550 RepID=A0ABR1FA14_9ASCO
MSLPENLAPGTNAVTDAPGVPSRAFSLPAPEFPPLPYIPTIRITTMSEEALEMARQMELGEAVWTSCPAKMVMAGVGGFALGGLFSLMMGAMAYDVPVGMGGKPLSDLPLKEQFRIQAKDLGTKMWGSAKNFGKIGGIFSGVECCVESFRAKNDLYNGVVAGCLTGGALAYKNGPQAALSGCAAFAAFSGAIDYYMRLDERPPPSTDED